MHPLFSRRLFAPCLAAALAGSLLAAPADVPLPDDPNAPAAKKGAKPAALPAMAPVQDVPGLPRVLIIGDSISIGYTVPVRKLLEGKANVHRIPTNGGHTKNGVTNLTK